MDYGRLAYLKALDLEGLLSVDKDRFGVWQNDLVDIGSGRVFVAQIDGRGDIAVFIESSSEADFYVDENKVASGKNVFFRIGAGSKIYAQSSGIEKLHIMALGRVASIDSSALINADMYADDIFFIVNQNGRAVVYVYNTTWNSLSNQNYSSKYVYGDVCQWGDSVFYALLTANGNLEIGDWQGARLLELGASKVAISGCDDGLYLAYLKGGELYFFLIEKLSSDISPVKLDFTGTIDDIRMVKKGSGLLFSSNGRCFFKDLNSSGKIRDKIYVTLHGEVL